MTTKTKNETKEPESNKPAAVFRARGMKASVFGNAGENGIFYKSTLQRVYKQGEEWKTTQALGRDDLLVAQYLLGKAWEFILQAESNQKGIDDVLS